MTKSKQKTIEEPPCNSTPIIQITAEQEALIAEVIHQAQIKFGECSWIGTGYWDAEDRIAYIEDIHWPQQENNTSKSDIDDAAMADIVLDCHNNEQEILWWGHSHGNMDAFFSGTDEQTWDNWTHFNEKDFFLASVHTTKRGEKPCYRIYWKGASFDIKEKPIEIFDETLITNQAQEALANMTKCVPIPSTSHHQTSKKQYSSSEQGLWDLEYGGAYSDWGTIPGGSPQLIQTLGKTATNGTTSGQKTQAPQKPYTKKESKKSSKASTKKL